MYQQKQDIILAYETGEKHKNFCLKQPYRHYQLLPSPQSESSKCIKSKFKLEYFDITVIWECTACGISQACTTGSTKPLQLNRNLAISGESKYSTYLLHFQMNFINHIVGRVFLNDRYNSVIRSYMMTILFVFYSNFMLYCIVVLLYFRHTFKTCGLLWKFN